jgi:hypothetical protein
MLISIMLISFRKFDCANQKMTTSVGLNNETQKLHFKSLISRLIIIFYF